MNRNNPLMKTFHKPPTYKKIPNIETIYQNNHYLIQVMKKTEKMTCEKPFQEKALALKNTLRKIHTETNFYKNPLINKLKNENETFESDYKKISKKKSKSATKYILNDLIDAYKKRNYKIPKFSSQNNIFKINPLIEENAQKMLLFFQKKGKTINVKQEKASNKIILFLNKLNRIIKRINAQKKSGIIIQKSEKKGLLKNFINKNMKTKDNEDVIKLTKDISLLKKLLNDKSFTEFNDISSFRKSSYSLKNLNFSRNSRNKNYNRVPLKKKKSNTINIQSPSKKKLNSQYNEDNLLLPKNKNDKKRSIPVELSPNNFLISRCFTKNSNKSQKDSYFDIANSSVESKSIKKESEKNLINKTKNNKKHRKNIPIFIHTQATKNKESDNEFFLSDKKTDFKLKTRNINLISSIYSNRTDFVNFAYKKVVKGKYNENEMENCIKKYLIESKDMSEEESLATINKIKKAKNYLGEDVEIKVRKSDLFKKSEKIYLNNFMIKRIEPALLKMKKGEDLMLRLQNIYSNIGK